MAGASSRHWGAAVFPSPCWEAGAAVAAHASLEHIRRRADYLRIQKNSARVVSTHFVFLLAACPLPARSRLGITVTRKVGTAVVRNRARRLVREAARYFSAFVPTGIDMVVVVRSALIDMRVQEVLQEWQGVSRLVRSRSAAWIQLQNTHPRAQL